MCCALLAFNADNILWPAHMCCGLVLFVFTLNIKPYGTKMKKNI